FPQKNTRWEWLNKSGVLNSRSKPVASRVNWVSGTPGSTCWNWDEGVGTGMMVLGRRNVGDPSTGCATAAAPTWLLTATALTTVEDAFKNKRRFIDFSPRPL